MTERGISGRDVHPWFAFSHLADLHRVDSRIAEHPQEPLRLLRRDRGEEPPVRLRAGEADPIASRVPVRDPAPWRDELEVRAAPRRNETLRRKLADLGQDAERGRLYEGARLAPSHHGV